jgi:molecular chaperone GrpE
MRNKIDVKENDAALSNADDGKKLSQGIDALIQKNSARIEELKQRFDSFFQDQVKLDELKKKIMDTGVLPADLSREHAGDYLSSILENLKKGNETHGFTEDFRERLSECKAESDLEKCFEDTYQSCADVEKILLQSAEGMFTLMLEQYRAASYGKKEHETVKAELEKYKKLSEEYLEMSRNLKKDYNRMRERLTKEKEEIAQIGNRKLLSQMLEIADNLGEAIRQCGMEPDGEKSVHFKGICLVRDRLNKVFSDNQVKEMEVVGKNFDPVFHEALAQDTESDEEEGTITEVYKKGYFYQESVLRSALVRVSAGKTKSTAE